MFPPTGSGVLVHVAPFHDDYIIFLSRKCPKFDALFAKHIKESPEIQRIYSKNKHNFEYWSKKTGKHIKTMDDVKKLHKTLYIESLHNET